ncbi:MAG: DUF4038 domain-containing protein [Maribacter sp.]
MLNKTYFQLYFVVLSLFTTNIIFSQISFPLKVSENNRYLEDSNGKPFFYNADTPWHLFFDLRIADAEFYIKRRKEQGFNTLQIMLTGAKGQVDFQGESPFLGDHDFSRPNERFFSRVDDILELLEKYEMYVAIVPLWSGCCGGDMAGNDKQGNPLPMLVNGPEKTRDFGKWVGQRYGDYKNIMWIIGGDNDPFNALEEYNALAQGLRETTTDQLFTYHAASTHSSTDVYPDADWLDVSMIYTYFRGFNKAWNKIQPDVYEVAYDEYRKKKTPFFLGESNYEREHGDWGNPTQIRKQAYWAALSGATGHAYGSVNWKIPENWKEMLELPGANSLIHLKTLMDAIGFPVLEPNWNGSLIQKGAGQYASNDYAVGAFTEKSNGAILYIPSGREITINEEKMKIESLQWFNPRNGATNSVDMSFDLRTPTNEDWVLLINIHL